MTPAEAEELARKLLAHATGPIEAGKLLAVYVLGLKKGAVRGSSLPEPAEASEHDLHNAVLPPKVFSEASGDPGLVRDLSGSFASLACCNKCSGEHHHCPSCNAYVKGEVLYCSATCEKTGRVIG